MLKLKIKSLVCRIVLSVCVFIPILFSDGLFDYTRTYLGILAVSLLVGYLSYNGFVHAERKLFRMRKKAVQIKNEENTQVERAA